MQVAEAQARLEHNKQYIAFLQHQIDLKLAKAARQKAREDEVCRFAVPRVGGLLSLCASGLGDCAIVSPVWNVARQAGFGMHDACGTDACGTDAYGTDACVDSGADT